MSTVDAAGNLHSAHTGQFTGHVRGEADTTVALLEQPVNGYQLLRDSGLRIGVDTEIVTPDRLVAGDVAILDGELFTVTQPEAFPYGATRLFDTNHHFRQTFLFPGRKILVARSGHLVQANGDLRNATCQGCGRPIAAMSGCPFCHGDPVSYAGLLDGLEGAAFYAALPQAGERVFVHSDTTEPGIGNDLLGVITGVEGLDGWDGDPSFWIDFPDGSSTLVTPWEMFPAHPSD